MSSFSSQPVVIDGKAHLLGRLASIVSKQVSCELVREGERQAGGHAGGMEEWEAGGFAARRDMLRVEQLGWHMSSGMGRMTAGGNFGRTGRVGRWGDEGDAARIQAGPVLTLQILMGQKVTIVRCEEINVSGSFFRNKLKYHDYLHSECRFPFRQ